MYLVYPYLNGGFHRYRVDMMASLADKLSVVILAAGLGTRMKSSKAKVLHELHGEPMITYVVKTAQAVAGKNIVLVIGNQAEKVKSVVAQTVEAAYALQSEQLGTGHAVQCALPQVPVDSREVVILYGDVPLLRSETVEDLVNNHRQQLNDVTVLAVKMADPTGYGRILCDDQGRLRKIVEQADADKRQKSIKLINSGIYCVNRAFLEQALADLKADNQQGELYLTDIIAIGYKAGKKMGYLVGRDCNETVGINTPQDLLRVEAIMKMAQSNRT